MSTIKVPRIVKMIALKKWNKGKSCKRTNWKKWWDNEGSISCNFCDYYRKELVNNFSLSDYCDSNNNGMCPLSDYGDCKCSNEWLACRKAFDDNNYNDFIIAATAMHTRILRLEEE